MSSFILVYLPDLCTSRIVLTGAKNGHGVPTLRRSASVLYQLFPLLRIVEETVV